MGIAVLSAVLFSQYHANLADRIGRAGLNPSRTETDTLRRFLLHSEETGLRPGRAPATILTILVQAGDAFISAFATTMWVAAAIAGAGALASLFLVTKGDRVAEKIFVRRSRWAYANPGGAGLTRKPMSEAE